MEHTTNYESVRSTAFNNLKKDTFRIGGRPLSLHRSHRVNARLDDIRREIHMLEDALMVVDNLSVWLADDHLKNNVVLTAKTMVSEILPLLDDAYTIIKQAQEAFGNGLVDTLKAEIAQIAAQRIREPVERISAIAKNILVNGGY